MNRINKIQVEAATLKAFEAITARKKIAIFAVLITLSVYIPTLIHSQIITGSLVNMALILSTSLLGPYIALIIGLLPSSFAVLSGLLPAPLMPMIPFIMISNAILVIVFFYVSKKNTLGAVFSAAFLKFAFLFASGSLITSFFLSNEQVATLVGSMMGWMQFLTASIGGISALLILKAIEKTRVLK
ncbi:MAG: ECF transporter S component [Candidatus Paceibacterota bacterium]